MYLIVTCETSPILVGCLHLAEVYPGKVGENDEDELVEEGSVEC